MAQLFGIQTVLLDQLAPEIPAEHGAPEAGTGPSRPRDALALVPKLLPWMEPEPGRVAFPPWASQQTRPMQTPTPKVG